MENFGFYKIAAASLKLKVANPKFNCEEIKEAIAQANKKGAKILVTPELSISSATCNDLFFQHKLLKTCENSLGEIVQFSKGIDVAIIVGMPIRITTALYNCAVVIRNGRILGAVPKTYINSDEKRYFTSGEAVCTTKIICNQEVRISQQLFSLSNNLIAGIEISDDLWSVIPPSSKLSLAGANLIINLSASSEAVTKNEYRENLIKNQSAKCICAYAYANASVNESTTDYVFGGSCCIAENGSILAKNKRFERNTSITYSYIDIQKINNERIRNSVFNDCAKTNNFNFNIVDDHFNSLKLIDFDRFIDPNPFVPSDQNLRNQRCREIFNIQAAGLAKRLQHTHLTKCVIGISGGLDSTLALLVAVHTMSILGLDNSNIIGITMPGFGTTGRTYSNSINLMKSLNITIKEIDIKPSCLQHMSDIGQNPEVHDVTYENTQARERTQILMDLANKIGAILVGTGDLSEAAMGWCTYNGDHMSMYGVNAGVPKTLVRYLVAYVADNSEKTTADILNDVLETPVSPELLPPDKNGKIAQKTEDNIGPYELHDFFLYHFIRFGTTKEKLTFMAQKAFKDKYSDDEIEKWLNLFIKRFFISQFKRSCTPDAPKVGSVSLSPRGDWKMPSDADMSIWF